MSKKVILGASLFAILLILPAIGYFAFAIPQASTSRLPFEVPQTAISWDLESYYNYTGPRLDIGLKRFRVYINDSDPLYNWSVWSSYPWLTGSGTKEDPYIIEKLLIDAQGDGGCLWIFNSTKHFIIRQSYFANTGLNEYDIGVFMGHTKNGELYGNIIDHAKTGFYITYTCSDITIYRNFMRGTRSAQGGPRPIRAFYSGAGAQNCSFTQNVIQNYEELAYISNTINITVDGNFMNNTEYDEYIDPVISVHNSGRMRFRNNIFTDNYQWFRFEVSQVDSANNTIANNGVITSLGGIQLPTPLSISPPSTLQAAQSSTTIMGLTSTTNSQITNNYIYQPGAIPGFELLVLLVAIGMTGAMLAFAIIYNKRTLARSL